MTELKPNSIWRHNKTGRIYRIICLSKLESDPNRIMVTYQPYSFTPVGETFDNWTRPETEWTELVEDGKPRFALTDGGNQT